MAKWKIAGINFDHMHMGDNLNMVADHPDCDLVGLCDEQPTRMADAIAKFNISDDRVFTDYRECLERTKPDLVILCPATAEHALWTQRIAPFGVHILMEKPFAATLVQADAMIDAMRQSGRQLAINWPLAWVASHRTAKRLIDEGVIGQVIEVHYYDGNRGPLYHTADKVEVTPDRALAQKRDSWFYDKSRGGGSLLDYLGYGTTLGTWLMNGRQPIEVTCTVFKPPGLEVDEHSITVARYETGLSKFETRWGTFTDPWTHQPQPRCGFVLVGEEGTIASYDYASSVCVQTRDEPQGRDIPADMLEPPLRNPVQYVIDCLERGRAIEGPLSPAISRIGQQIVDTAMLSAERRCTVSLIP